MKKSVSVLRQELSSCEEVVMNVLWDSETPMTCLQIMQQLSDKYELDYKDTTVYTFLKVLMEKGFVTKTRNKINYYQPCSDRTREKYLAEKFELIAGMWFNQDSEQMIEFLKKQGK